MGFGEGDHVLVPLDPRLFGSEAHLDDGTWWAAAVVEKVHPSGGLSVSAPEVGRAYCPPGVARPLLALVKDAA